MAVKYVFVTGGVVSGLGKGITAASLGRLLKARGYQVTMQKFDPYINIDPGTMNPIQHGEVFVTDDGTETDLDLGHYERFIDESLDKELIIQPGIADAYPVEGEYDRLDEGNEEEEHKPDQPRQQEQPADPFDPAFNRQPAPAAA